MTFAFKSFKRETKKAANPGADSLSAFICKSTYLLRTVKNM